MVLLQKIAILLIIVGSTAFASEKAEEKISIPSLFERYGLNLESGYFEKRSENDCPVIFIKELVEKVSENGFIDPLLLKSDYCDFLKYIEARQCKGILADFAFFFDKGFLEKIYDRSAGNEKLQSFLSNIFVLFFLFPQKKTCDNTLCKHGSCVNRDDLNIYKAYGAVKMYISLYVDRFETTEEETTRQVQKLLKEIMQRMVPFVQDVLNLDEKHALRIYIDHEIKGLIRKMSLERVKYLRQDVDQLRTHLIAEIFTPIPQEEKNIQLEIEKERKKVDSLDKFTNLNEEQTQELKNEIEKRISRLEQRREGLREKRINPQPTKYQQYFKTLKGFLKRGQNLFQKQ